MPSHAPHFKRAFISVNRLRGRQRPVLCDDWIMDSGAFTEISTHGEYRHCTKLYAAEILRQHRMSLGLRCAVAQDYMCESHILEKTGKTILEHQRLTIDRYDSLMQDLGGEVNVLPVLQGFHPDDYIRHLDSYGERLPDGAYVGVGSVCKRNSDVKSIEAVLGGIKRERPDLRLHAFGIKITSLRSRIVCDAVESTDSIAWSYAARIEGRNQNSWEEAYSYEQRVLAILESHNASPAS